MTASQIVLALQTLRSRILSPLSANVITVGIIRGGDRNNIIPAEVYLEGTIRTFDTGRSRTRSKSACATSSTGRRRRRTRLSSSSFDRSHPLTKNDLPLTDRMVPTLQRIVGKENVSVVPPETGAEDFSFFSNLVPGFYYKLGVVPEGSRRVATTRRRSMLMTRRCRSGFAPSARSCSTTWRLARADPGIP